MKNLNIFILLAIVCLNYSFAQTPEEKAKIVAKYDVEAIKALQKEIQIVTNERNLRVEDFLKTNDISAVTFVEGKRYVIYDIIDNQPIYRTSDNENSATATRTNFLHSGGGLGLNIEGQNMILGVWELDGYPLVSHVEYQNNDFPPVSRVTTPDFATSAVATPENHAAHVSGTLISKGTEPFTKGMAPQASLVAYDANSDAGEVASEASTNGLMISNHSYGVPVQQPGGGTAPTWLMGCYDSNSVVWDNIAFNSPYYLHVVSAGNSGLTTYTGGLANGYDKLTQEKNAKNNMVVANAANPVVAGDGTLSSASINVSSSQGPSDDGRIKPDIAGDGTQVYSTFSTGIQDYGSFSGTSMAAPNVAGSLILLQQLYNDLNSQFMRAATLKGLACHTADDDTSRVGPDPIFGWGLLNAKAAAETIIDSNTNNAIISELTLNQDQTYNTTFNTSGGGPITVTICWTDPAGVSQSGQLNSSTPALVNDLDVRLIAPDGTTTYFPWKLQLSNLNAIAIKADNVVDTVEKIDLDSSVAGTYTVEVSHKLLLENNSQDFSLIVTAPSLSLSTEDYAFSGLNIWPNPANDFVNISFLSQNSVTTTINLIDSLGRIVKEKVLNNNSSEINERIDLRDLSKGIYFVKITKGNFSQVKKIVH